MKAIVEMCQIFGKFFLVDRLDELIGIEVVSQISDLICWRNEKFTNAQPFRNSPSMI
jgi:hypothetical protein